MRLTLFDLDGTLLPIDSDHAFGEFMVRIGWSDAGEYRRRNDLFFQDYLAGRLDIDAYIDFATRSWRTRAPGEIAAASQRFMREVITPSLREPARELVERHRREGDELVIITATMQLITAPIARAFGIEHLIATELQHDAQGRVTGRIDGRPALREGKVARLEQWLDQRRRSWTDFERITFYSDSSNDLPLLERVSHPVATNPAPELEHIAQSRGWPILKLFS